MPKNGHTHAHTLTDTHIYPDGHTSTNPNPTPLPPGRPPSLTRPHPTSLGCTLPFTMPLHSTPLHSTPSTPNSAFDSWVTRKAACGFNVGDNDTDLNDGDRVPKSLQTWKWQDLALLRVPCQGVFSRQHGVFRSSRAFREFWTRALTYAWCVRKGCCPWGQEGDRGTFLRH